MPEDVPVTNATRFDSAPGIRLNRYQDFDAEQVDRALLIREHQTLGFTLREIAVLSEEFSRGISLQRQAQVMRERLAAIE
jgi:DNA-binding transcriptional MerR regulator